MKKSINRTYSMSSPMAKITDHSGVSLIELLIASAMVVGVVVSISLFFPKVSANLVNNRRQQIAANFAAGRMQEIKNQPYQLIDLTLPAEFNAAGCNCSQDDLSGVNPKVEFVEDGVTYTRTECVNLVWQRPDQGWDHDCPDGTPLKDRGLKNIRIRISWGTGSNAQHYDLESLAAR